MAVVHLNADSFQDTISKGKVMVDFWAPWCMPCQSLLPVIDELGEELDGNAVVAKVNVDENKPLAMKFGVMSIPTVIFFADGVEKERLVKRRIYQSNQSAVITANISRFSGSFSEKREFFYFSSTRLFPEILYFI